MCASGVHCFVSATVVLWKLPWWRLWTTEQLSGNWGRLMLIMDWTSGSPSKSRLLAEATSWTNRVLLYIYIYQIKIEREIQCAVYTLFFIQFFNFHILSSIMNLLHHAWLPDLLSLFCFSLVWFCGGMRKSKSVATTQLPWTGNFYNFGSGHEVQIQIMNALRWRYVGDTFGTWLLQVARKGTVTLYQELDGLMTAQDPQDEMISSVYEIESCMTHIHSWPFSTEMWF